MLIALKFIVYWVRLSRLLSLWNPLVDQEKLDWGFSESHIIFVKLQNSLVDQGFPGPHNAEKIPWSPMEPDVYIPTVFPTLVYF